jgi:hypothetical protein
LGAIMRVTGLVLLSITLGCGGVGTDHPLTIPLGLQRAQADAQLRTHRYCIEIDGARADVETYPRCDRPGTDWGESWVVAKYESDRLVELRRYERFSDDTRANERWNALVAARQRATPASPEAAQALRKKLLEPGTRTVQAFRIDADTIVGIYLLSPTPPDEASILEAVIRIPVN